MIWANQHTMEESFRLDRRAPWYLTRPINTAAVRPADRGTDPAPRFYPHLLPTLYPQEGYGQARFPSQDGESARLPLVAGQRRPRAGPGRTRPRAVRDLAGSGRARHPPGGTLRDRQQRTASGRRRPAVRPRRGAGADRGRRAADQLSVLARGRRHRATLGQLLDHAARSRRPDDLRPVRRPARAQPDPHRDPRRAPAGLGAGRGRPRPRAVRDRHQPGADRRLVEDSAERAAAAAGGAAAREAGRGRQPAGPAVAAGRRSAAGRSGLRDLSHRPSGELSAGRSGPPATRVPRAFPDAAGREHRRLSRAGRAARRPRAVRVHQQGPEQLLLRVPRLDGRADRAHAAQRVPPGDPARRAGAGREPASTTWVEASTSTSRPSTPPAPRWSCTATRSRCTGTRSCRSGRRRSPTPSGRSRWLASSTATRRPSSWSGRHRRCPRTRCASAPA